MRDGNYRVKIAKVYNAFYDIGIELPRSSCALLLPLLARFGSSVPYETLHASLMSIKDDDTLAGRDDLVRFNMKNIRKAVRGKAIPFDIVVEKDFGYGLYKNELWGKPEFKSLEEIT